VACPGTLDGVPIGSVDVETSPALFVSADRTAVRFIPQMGHLPGLSWRTCGCMAQVQMVGLAGATSFGERHPFVQDKIPNVSNEMKAT
jgi:hypothetical protein